MYTNNFDGTDPEAYLAGWRCDKIPTPQNGWQGENMPRFCSADYDKLSTKLAATSKLEDRIAIVKQMNDILTDEGVQIPLVYRGQPSAFTNTLQGIKMTGWDSELWNVADWSRKK